MGHWSFKTFLGLWTKISEEARIGVVKVGFMNKNYFRIGFMSIKSMMFMCEIYVRLFSNEKSSGEEEK
jgi:hypothetical protein